MTLKLPSMELPSFQGLYAADILIANNLQVQLFSGLPYWQSYLRRFIGVC
jgi:hypothetical protein